MWAPHRCRATVPTYLLREPACRTNQNENYTPYISCIGLFPDVFARNTPTTDTRSPRNAHIPLIMTGASTLYIYDIYTSCRSILCSHAQFFVLGRCWWEYCCIPVPVSRTGRTHHGLKNEEGNTHCYYCCRLPVVPAPLEVRMEAVAGTTS